MMIESNNLQDSLQKIVDHFQHEISLARGEVYAARILSEYALLTSLKLTENNQEIIDSIEDRIRRTSLIANESGPESDHENVANIAFSRSLSQSLENLRNLMKGEI